MAVIKGERQARFQGKTLPNVSEARHPSTGGGTFSHAPGHLRTAPRPINRAPQPSFAPRYSGRGGGFGHLVGHALAVLNGSENIYGRRPAPTRIAGRSYGAPPSSASQLGSITGLNQARPLAHPLRFIQQQRRLDPQQKANQAIGLTMLAGGLRGGGAADQLSKTTRAAAAFDGDLRGVMFGHGSPSPFREFNYRLRNPNSVLGGGVYSNTTGERFGQYASMSPASSRNMNPWMTARFLDEQKAREFAVRRTLEGHEVEGGAMGPSGPLVAAAAQMTHRAGKSVGEIAASSHFANAFKRVSLLTPASARERITARQIRENSIIGGHRAQARIGVRSGTAEHFVVKHRKPVAPAVRPMGVTPNTRLFDMRAPIDPGEATRALELLRQRAGVIGQVNKRIVRGESQMAESGDKARDWAHYEIGPEGSISHQLQSMNRLAALARAGRAGKRSDLERVMGGFGRNLDKPPIGRDLHAVINDALLRMNTPSEFAHLTDDQLHITGNPNAILRGMGYHGLIDPEFHSPAPGNAKEIVMFDKHKFEPWTQHLDRLRQNEKGVPVGVRMARQLQRGGIDFVGAVKGVRASGGQATLPLSDELNMNIVKIGNKVRFFVSPAQHPDAVGQEINGVQALNLAHRNRFVRRGGNLTNQQVRNALYGPGSEGAGSEWAEGSNLPMTSGDLLFGIKHQLPDLKERFKRLYDPEATTGVHEVEQLTAMGNERKKVQLANMHKLFDQGPVSIKGIGGRGHLAETYRRVPANSRQRFEGHKFMYRTSDGGHVSEDRMFQLLNSATSVNGKRLPVSDSPDEGALGGLTLRYHPGDYPPSLDTVAMSARPGEKVTGLRVDADGNAHAIDFEKLSSNQYKVIEGSQAVKPLPDPADVRDFMRQNFHLPKVVRGNKRPLTKDEAVAKLKARGTEILGRTPNRFLQVRENGVQLPPEAFPFRNGYTWGEHGTPIGSYRKPPRWFQMLDPGALGRLLEGTPGKNFEEKARYLDEHYQPGINREWELQRTAGMKELNPVAGQPLLARALQLARQHGLSGEEARLFIRSYLKTRGN